MSTRISTSGMRHAQLCHSPYSAAAMAPKTISTGEMETMGESGRLFWFFTSDSRAIARKVSEKLDGS